QKELIVSNMIVNENPSIPIVTKLSRNQWHKSSTTAVEKVNENFLSSTTTVEKSAITDKELRESPGYKILLRRDRAWGDTVTLQGAADAFEVKIVVLHSSEDWAI
ncbi:hypothetical protein Tco_1443282, partial [Tanacetum coccineum]